MSLDTLDGMLAHELSDLLSAEKPVRKALQQRPRPPIATGSSNMAEAHLAETKQQAENLKQAFGILGQKPEKMVCKGAQGIVEENMQHAQRKSPKAS
jgi:ferritin-like metal-binding protein YciE